MDFFSVKKHSHPTMYIPDFLEDEDVIVIFIDLHYNYLLHRNHKSYNMFAQEFVHGLPVKYGGACFGPRTFKFIHMKHPGSLRLTDGTPKITQISNFF